MTNLGKMLAGILVEPKRFEIREIDIPEIGPDEALIKVARTGICGTDIHIFNGHYAREQLPLVPGHEFCGTVERVGCNVRNLNVGQQCVADINVGCGTCFFCRQNEILNCAEIKQIGINRDGGFAEYVVIPARLVISVPNGVPAEIQALVEPVACVVRAARKSQLRFGQSVVVLGAGPVGNLHVQMARLCGAAPIIVADLSKERCAMAVEAGADIAVSEPAELVAKVRALTGGRGADIVIESVGSTTLYQTAFDLIRKGGHVSFFGLTAPGQTVSVDILRTILEENGLKGSVAGMGEDMYDALTLLAHGRVRTEAFTRSTFPLAHIQDAFETIASRPNDLKTQIVFG